MFDRELLLRYNLHDVSDILCLCTKLTLKVSHLRCYVLASALAKIDSSR